MSAGTPLLAVALALAVGQAAAGAPVDDPDGPGRAASVSYRVPQRVAPIAVLPLDNSPRNVTIATQIKKALQQRGVSVADDAPLALEFDTATEGAATHPPHGALREPPRVDIGRRRDLGRGDAIDARVDLYSNTRSSLLTGVRKPEMGLRYVLRATLAEREGARLWEGYAAYGAIAGDDERVFAAMAPLLADLVGRTTGERRFRID